MKKLRTLLIAFKKRHAPTKAKATTIDDAPGGSVNHTKEETKDKKKKDGEKVSISSTYHKRSAKGFSF